MHAAGLNLDVKDISELSNNKNHIVLPNVTPNASNLLSNHLDLSKGHELLEFFLHLPSKIKSTVKERRKSVLPATK